MRLPQRPTNISELRAFTLTADQAFRAMGKFLEAFWQRNQGQGHLGAVMGDVRLERDGRTEDPAALTDWATAVNAVLAEDPEATGASDAVREAYKIRLDHSESFFRDVAEILGGGDTQRHVFGKAIIIATALPSADTMLAEIRRLKTLEA